MTDALVELGKFRTAVGKHLQQMVISGATPDDWLRLSELCLRARRICLCHVPIEREFDPSRCPTCGGES